MLHPDLLRLIDTSSPYVYRAQVSLTNISADNSATDKIIIQDRPFICTRAVVTMSHFDGTNASRILDTRENQDLMRIFMRLTGGQRDLMQEPIDVHAFNKAFGDDTFAGILFPTKTEIITTIYNTIMTASNFQMPVTIDIALFGYHSRVSSN